MSDKAQAKWDYSRFLATLNYFGEVPFLGSFRWLQHWLGQNQNFPGTTLSAMKKKVLVIGSERADRSDAIEAAPSNVSVTETRSFKLDGSKSNAFGSELSKLLQQKLGESTDFLFYDRSHQLQEARWDELQQAVSTFREPTENSQSDLTKLVRAVDTVVLLSTAADWAGMSSALGCCQDAWDDSDSKTVIQQVFDFSEADSEAGSEAGSEKGSDLAAWGSLDDVVMGGVSEGSFFNRDGYAVFAGSVSTNNSGGFSSVRTKNFEPPFDFSGWEGMQLKVKGDGQRYKFIARNSSGWDSPAYIYGVDTLKDEWTTVRIPFESMVATFRARSVADAPAFDPARVFSLQLMLSKFEFDRQLNPCFSAGAFELLVNDISIYRPRRGLPLVVLGSQDENICSRQKAALEKAKVEHRLVTAPSEQTDDESIAGLVDAIASVLT